MRDARDGVAFFIRDMGFKQASVACKAGLTEQQLSDIINKRRKMDANEMFAICRAIKIDPNSLFEQMGEHETSGTTQDAALAS